MVQHLLEQRFKLAIHWERREVTAYDLVVANTGPKFKEAAETSQPEDSAAAATPLPGGPLKLDKDGYPGLTGATGMAVSNGRARMHQLTTMGYLAIMVSAQVGSPVTDATGLSGKYDLTLTWSQLGLRMNAAVPDGDTGPTIFTALQEQLGLKLEQKKASIMRWWWTNHVEKTPTEN